MVGAQATGFTDTLREVGGGEKGWLRRAPTAQPLAATPVRGPIAVRRTRESSSIE
jgi:hypothetical protein